MDNQGIWSVLSRHQTGLMAQTSFIRVDSDEICLLPTEFVEAFLDDVVLDAKFEPQSDDRSKLNLIRGGKIDAVIPASLLKHLLNQRNATISTPETDCQSQFQSHSHY